MVEAGRDARATKRGLRTAALASVLALLAATVHHAMLDPSVSTRDADRFLASLTRRAERGGFRRVERHVEPRVEIATARVPPGACYVFAVAWTGRLAPAHDVLYGCTGNEARLSSRRPRWSSFSVEALDPVPSSTRTVLLLGRAEDGFDPVTAIAAGIPLDPGEFVRNAHPTRSTVRVLGGDASLIRATVATDTAIAWPASPTTLLAIDAASDLRPGRGPISVLPSHGGPLASSQDAALVELHVARRSNASLKRTPIDRRAIAVVDPSLAVRNGCVALTFRFAGLGDPSTLEAHAFGTGTGRMIPVSSHAATDTLCGTDPVTIYSVEATSTHDVILEGSVGTPHAPYPPAPFPSSFSGIRAMLRGEDRPRDPLAALSAVDAIPPGSLGELERVELRGEAHARLARDPAYRELMLTEVRTGCESGSGFLCALNADIERRAYGVPLDLALTRTLLAHACAAGHTASCALGTVAASDLGPPTR